MRINLQTATGDWSTDVPRGRARLGDGTPEGDRPPTDPASGWPTALEFVKTAALRIKHDERRIRDQAARIAALEAERIADRERIRDLEAIVSDHDREHLETLELIEQSWVECSLLRVALREAAREAETAERHIRSSIEDIARLKLNLGER